MPQCNDVAVAKVATSLQRDPSCAECSKRFKKTVVFLGRPSDADVRFFATGFLLQIQNIFHLATAKHVVQDPRTGQITDEGMVVYFNHKDGTIGSRSMETIKALGISWVFHPLAEVDIAVIPFGLDTQTDDVKTIPDNLFLGTENLVELYDVFFLSYQPGIRPERHIVPVVRNGTISLVKEDGTFYIDGSAFPGNSGSPVFLKPSGMRFTDEGLTIGGDELGGKFIGIVGEYLPYQEVAVSTQTGRPRVIFEENTGLSRVWSVRFLHEIMGSDEFKAQVERLTPKQIGEAQRQS